jgi:MerR family transcriptional regulator, light-induced transcriptional regulator
MQPSLTIAQLSERTGVAAATLRMWEARHGFPTPARMPGGHRRYAEHEVEAVRAVSREREHGLSLAAAIGRAIAAQAPAAAAPSVYAGLSSRRAELAPIRLTKPRLLALTRAIEDEHLARGGGGVLVGSFQRARFYRQSEHRWRELARTAQNAVAIADFKTLRTPAGRPAEVPIASQSPLAREWTIAFHAPNASACLSAWEMPGPGSGVGAAKRRFEVVWSPEPEIARAAILIAAESISPHAPGVAADLLASLAPAPPSSAELRAAARQAHRMLSYLAKEER